MGMKIKIVARSKNGQFETLYTLLEFHILHFSNSVFFLAVLPLVVLTGWAEAREPTPQHTAISLKRTFL